MLTRFLCTDDSCSNGDISAGWADNEQVMLCVCFNETSQKSTRGWYCWG